MVNRRMWMDRVAYRTPRYGMTKWAAFACENQMKKIRMSIVSIIKYFKFTY